LFFNIFNKLILKIKKKTEKKLFLYKKTILESNLHCNLKSLKKCCRGMCNWEIFCKKQEVPNPWSRASLIRK